MSGNFKQPDMVLFYLKASGIQKYLDKDGITEIIINQTGEIITEGENGWEFHKEEGATFDNLNHLAVSLTAYNNLKAINHSDPVKSMVLPNGERSQVIYPPACEEGRISMTIRKPSLNRFTLENYLDSGRFDNVLVAEKKGIELTQGQQKMLTLYEKSKKEAKYLIDFIREGVNQRMNFLIVGGTGSGKTTVAKAIADEFPKDRRIITIEDVHEMPLPLHPNKVHLFYKAGIIAPKFLIESAMRMKPDHIFLAELRGEEAWSYIEALNTGHEGSVSTIHANDTYSAYARLASIVKQSKVGMTLDYQFIENTIKSSIDIVMFFEKTKLKEIYYNPHEKNEILYGSSMN